MPKTIANCPAEAVGGRAALEEALAAAGVVPDFRRVFNPNYDFEDYDDPSNEDYFLGLARHSPYGSDEIIISAATIEHTLYLPLIGEAGEYDNVVEFPHETGPDGPFISAAAIAAIVERAKRLATHAAKTNRRLEGLTWRKAREAARGDDALTVAMARAALQRALRIRAGDTSNSHSPHDMTDFLDCHLAVLRLLPETQIAATLDMPAPATLLPLPIELRVHRPYEDVAEGHRIAGLTIVPDGSGAKITAAATGETYGELYKAIAHTGQLAVCAGNVFYEGFDQDAAGVVNIRYGT